MGLFADKLNKLLESKGVKPYAVAMEIGLDPALVWNVVKGKRPPSDRVIEALSESQILELTQDQIKGLLALEKYGPEAIKEACKFLDS